LPIQLDRKGLAKSLLGTPTVCEWTHTATGSTCASSRHPTQREPNT